MNIRDLKLDIVLGNQNKIIDKFNEITKDLKVINENVYNDDDTEFIFYNQNNKWVFYQDSKNGNFWCNNIIYWSIFQGEYGFKYEEIQDLTKCLVEEVLKVKVDTPSTTLLYKFKVVEEVLKVKVDTPYLKAGYQGIVVEEVLKVKVDAPERTLLGDKFKIEETLKDKLK